MIFQANHVDNIYDIYDDDVCYNDDGDDDDGVCRDDHDNKDIKETSTISRTTNERRKRNTSRRTHRRSKYLSSYSSSSSSILMHCVMLVVTWTATTVLSRHHQVYGFVSQASFSSVNSPVVHRGSRRQQQYHSTTSSSASIPHQAVPLHLPERDWMNRERRQQSHGRNRHQQQRQHHQNTTATTTATAPFRRRSRAATTILTSTLLLPFGAFGLILPRLQVIGHQMALKFLAQPVSYLLIPVIAAWVGWFTNWLAVQMIFYPIEYCGIPLYRRDELPLGFIGWQGIIPCKTRRMTESMVEMVQTELLSVEEAFARIDPERVATLMSPELPIMARNIFLEIPSLAWLVTTSTTNASQNATTTTTTTTTTATPAATSILGSLVQTLSRWSEPSIRYYTDKFLIQLTKAMQGEHERVFNLRNCVVSQMLLNRAKLGELFRQCGQKELDFLVNSGIWFGFLLGLIQMAVALVWDNPWSLSIGGGIVGLATNWLALKWIFQPVDPYRLAIGPFSWILQGKFLRRQPEVSATFANYFSENILTADKIWASVLSDPQSRPNFQRLFAVELQAFLNENLTPAGFNKFPLLKPEEIAQISKKAMEQLPKHLPVLYPYMDVALGLEDTLRVKMEAMTSRRFERVLHPIFEEDELTLILAGAGLGFGTGLIQQGLETGYLVLPNLPRIAERLGKKCGKFFRPSSVRK